MKGTINKSTILGYVGKDPEVKATAGGTTIVNLSIATTERGPKGQDGSYADATEWHRVVLFGKLAETAASYVQKGSLLYIEGRMQTRKWQDQSGADRYSTEIVGNEMQFIGPKPATQPQQQQGQQQQGQQQQPQQQQQQPQYQPQPQQQQQTPSFPDNSQSGW
jgi:single-strand DNA-binding protein